MKRPADRQGHKAGMPAFGGRQWLVLVLIGLFGQIAWTIENMYLNLFVYHRITDNPHVIATMVAASAIVATVTTLFMGSWSDHIGKRRLLISVGYILWGLSTFLFGLADPSVLAAIFPAAETVRLGAIFIILFDCLMTFFGSTANDAAFSAWVTDVTVPEQRGRIQAVLAALPLLSMLLVFGLLDPLTQKGRWELFFGIVGGLTLLAGVVNFFLMKEPVLHKEATSFREKLIYGLRPGVVRKNRALYLIFLALFLSSCGVQVYMPYLMIYMQNFLKLPSYVLVLGIVLVGASVLSILAGRLLDRYGKRRAFLPALVLQLLGLLAIYPARKTLSVTLAGLLLMTGFLLLSACIQGLIQDHLPEGMAGRFQGIRMIFAVMLPMIIGPFIGSAVIRSSSATYVDLGQVKQVPTPGIFLAAFVVLLLTAVPFIFLRHYPEPGSDKNPPQEGGDSDTKEALPGLPTPYTEEAKANPLPENPRPQLSRRPEQRSLLNGLWNYSLYTAALPTEDRLEDVSFLRTSPRREGEIRVPFSPETLLSGVQLLLQPTDCLVYTRRLAPSDLPAAYDAKHYRLLLHFGAVDQNCVLYVNGKRAAENRGGYFAFSVDITPHLEEGEATTLSLFVTDPSDTGPAAYGKQRLKHGQIWYTPTSGMWQSVWLEAVPQSYLKTLWISPTPEHNRVHLSLEWEGEQPENPPVLSVLREAGLFNEPDLDFETAVNSLPQEAFAEVGLCTEKEGPLSPFEPGACHYSFTLDKPALWSPEHPRLYAFRLKLGEDSCSGYFALRTTTVEKDGRGVPLLFLNGESYVQIGVLDQGYWSDGSYTAPADRAIVDELLYLKRLGYNMVRKHIKLESARWYHHCDRLGLLVWQDMVSGGGPYRAPIIAYLPFVGCHLKDSHYGLFGRKAEASRQVFLEECERTVRQLGAVPSIVLWVPFNEGWGQFDAGKVSELVRRLDPTRPLDHASGWHDQGLGDLKSRHIYFRRPRLVADKKGRPYALTEFGGYNLAVPGHLACPKVFGYKAYPTSEAYQAGVLQLMEGLLREPAILSALVYTQVSDVEEEVNGLVTYDRCVQKWPPESEAAKRLRELHEQLRAFHEGKSTR